MPPSCSQLSPMSSHADSNEIMTWLRRFERRPRRVFVTHGEPAASDALGQRIERELGCEVTVPDYRDRLESV